MQSKSLKLIMCIRVGSGSVSGRPCSHSASRAVTAVWQSFHVIRLLLRLMATVYAVFAVCLVSHSALTRATDKADKEQQKPSRLLLPHKVQCNQLIVHVLSREACTATFNIGIGWRLADTVSPQVDLATPLNEFSF